MEAIEQWKATSGGGRGGKGLTQGKQPTGGRGSDTEPSYHVVPIGGCAPNRSRPSSRVPIDVRPEGGARCVSSARRDLCGGRGAILVPTATSSARRIWICLLGSTRRAYARRVGAAESSKTVKKSFEWSGRLAYSSPCPETDRSTSPIGRSVARFNLLPTSPSNANVMPKPR